ncbi:MAG: sensor histidine kinase [Bernardetiaceae bacterium]
MWQYLFHLPLWLLYEYFWFWLFDSHDTLLTWPGLQLLLGYLVAHAGGTYIVIYGLVPRLLSRKKYLLFGLSFVAVVGGATGITALGYYISLSPLGSWEDFYDSPRFIPATFASAANTLVLTLLLKLLLSWLRERQRSQALAHENLQNELNFLRAQWNPHFLFNTINTIYFLIKKDPELAADSLARFSDMLRYQLYQCNTPSVPMAREITFLQDFITLERLRKKDFPCQDNLSQVHTEGFEIAPNIFLPFIENAFKYVLTAKQPALSIHLTYTHNRWHLEVKNTFGTAPQTTVGGIGLANVRRRLDLIYGKDYQLEIETKAGWFIVQLVIPNKKYPAWLPSSALSSTTNP